MPVVDLFCHCRCGICENFEKNVFTVRCNPHKNHDTKLKFSTTHHKCQNLAPLLVAVIVPSWHKYLPLCAEKITATAAMLPVQSKVSAISIFCLCIYLEFLWSDEITIALSLAMVIVRLSWFLASNC